jgi:hypothetical protein
MLDGYNTNRTCCSYTDGSFHTLLDQDNSYKSTALFRRQQLQVNCYVLTLTATSQLLQHQQLKH